MSTVSWKVRKSDVGQFLKLAFPKYKGRKFTVRQASEHVITNSSWEGGSRTVLRAIVSGPDGFVVRELAEMKFEGARFVIPPAVLLVEHQFYCGGDLGLTFTYAPGSEFQKALPRPALAIE